MTVRHRVGRVVVAVVLIAGLLLGVLPTPPAHAPSVDRFRAAFVGPCGGAPAPTDPSGTLAVEGGPVSPTAADGVTVVYTYHFQTRLVNQATGAVEYVGCPRETANATTTDQGAFRFAVLTPPERCDPAPPVCLEYSGPFGPDSFTTLSPAPPGYSEGLSAGPGGMVLAWVYDLQSVALSPSASPFTVSPNAPLAFVAHALMANGSATPLVPAFGWTLTGTGWSFVHPPQGTNASVVATPGADVGTLSVSATATTSGVTLTTPNASATLLQQPTAIERGELNRTTVDAAGSIAAELIAVAAPGYPYTATVNPGLGLPAVAAGCRTAPGGAGLVNVSCSANLTYPLSGLAQPTARLTNGYSASSWQFPQVTVEALPALSVDPAAPSGYAGAPLPLRISVVPGTGAPPFLRGCLALQGTPVQCLGTPGPSWEFDPTFPAAGRFPVTAWAVDADGVNASATFWVAVVPGLTVSPISTNGTDPTAGASIALSAAVSGGALPLRYWWNASDLPGSLLAGASSSDGTLTAAFVPPSAGEATVSLTLLDALGTIEEVDRLLTVGPAGALSLVAVVPPPAAPVAAGASFVVAWEATDRAGGPVRTFSAPVVLRLSGAGAVDVASVDVAGLGPVPSLGNGSYGVPGSGWVDGTLNVSLRALSAGPLRIALAGSGLPGPVPPLEATVAPDETHLRLFDPSVALGGARHNATFWHVSDRFGNSAVGAFVTIRLAWGGASRTTLAATIAGPNGSVGVWVNYSAPGPGGGSLTVLDLSGEALLGPLPIPALPGPAPLSPAAVTIAAAVPIGAVGAVWSGLVRRRARARPTPATDEEELRRLAEGRGELVGLLARLGSADLRTLEAAWQPPPAPPALADWLASLIADGTVDAAVGSDGGARFRLAEGRPNPTTRVTVDAAVLERAIDRRDAELRGDSPGP